MDKIDKIVEIKNSLIQHGKYNDRVYLMKFAHGNIKKILEEMEEIASSNGYGKIFAKVPSSETETFKKRGYVQEGYIPYYFNDEEGCSFMSKFMDEERKKDMILEENELVIRKAFEKIPTPEHDIANGFNLKKANYSDIKKISSLFEEIFETYPFPIFDEKYIEETMKKNVDYYCIWNNGELAAVSSAEKDGELKIAEMTDFASSKKFRGNNLASLLLGKMEKDLKIDGYRVLYTIARSRSVGMNKTFARNGYTFSGKLINNTNISGDIESMNVWYKRI